LNETLERVEVILKAATHPRGHLKTRRDEEPPDATDAADEDMAWDETDDITELKLAHQEEYSAGEHGTQRIRCYGGRNHGIRVALADEVRDLESHTVKEGDDLDLRDDALAITARTSEYEVATTNQLRTNAAPEDTPTGEGYLRDDGANVKDRDTRRT